MAEFPGFGPEIESRLLRRDAKKQIGTATTLYLLLLAFSYNDRHVKSLSFGWLREIGDWPCNRDQESL